MNSYYPWHHAEWTQLQSRAARKQLPHALLLTGPVGIGKRVFADAFARALLCKQPLDDGAACGNCEACHLLRAGTHPDYLNITFLEDKTVIGIDQIRGLSRALNLKSHAGGYKVTLVQPAEQMTVEAANSLLKTLEEPTDNTILMLVTEQPARLAATIRSRCQRLPFPPATIEQGLAWLNTQLGDQASELLLRLADAAPLRALALAQDGTVASRSTWLEQMTGTRRGQLSPIAVAAEWAQDAQMRPLYWFMSYLKDMLRLIYGGSEFIKNIDLYDTLQVIANELGARELLSVLAQAEQIQQLTQQAGINRQLLLEGLLTDWTRAGRSRRVRA